MTRTVWQAALVGLVAGAVMMGGGCKRKNWEVDRKDPETVVDVSYRFDDEDARQVYQTMADDAAFRGWIDRWIQAHDGERPIVIVGDLKNNTEDYINTLLFTRSIERELLNSGRVRVVAMRDQRGQLRDERLQGHEWNSAETKKVLREELGADLMLLGDINDVRETSGDGRTKVIYFQINLDLTNLETNEKVWIGTAEIKKVAKR